MSTLKRTERIDMIYEYLTKEDDLVKNLDIFHNDKMTFHWANWKDTCLFQKKEVVRHRGSRKRLNDLVSIIEEYRKQKVWISTKKEVIESNLYELYQFYLDPRIRLNWLNRDEEMLISMVNNSGPYMALSSMRWFSDEVYKLFVYHKILTGNMSLRSFRIDVNIPVDVWLDQESLDHTTLLIKQLSEKGVLFNFSDRNSFFKLTNSNYIRVDLKGSDWDLFSEICGNLDHWKKIVKSDKEVVCSAELPNYIFEQYNNHVNLKISSSGGNFFFFVAYQDFINLGTSHSFEDVLEPVVGVVKDELGTPLHIKRAA